MPVAVAESDEKYPAAVTACRAPLVQQLGVVVIVTDDLGSYRRVVEELAVYHRVCLWHLWRWVGRALTELRPQLAVWASVIDEVGQLVRGLTARRRAALVAAVGYAASRRSGVPAEDGVDRLRQTIQHLHHGWPTYRHTLERPDVSRTNNGTEQAIGRFTSRGRQIRGHKAWQGVERTLLLSSGMRS
ncbi:MAG TPA: hypothetical protein VLA19_14985 [Herpetosiphonaceae bacterium]|nr:hypothetical protein [Herpetosiphonaceae bacterium]